MKQIKIILIAGLFVLPMSSCTNMEAEQSNIKQAIPVKETAIDNSIIFKLNGELVTTSGWNISRFKMTNDSRESLNITTNMHQEKRTFNVNIEGSEAGTYVIKGNDNSKNHFYGSYFPDYMNDLNNSYSFETGSFIINELDTVKNILNGTFSGTVKNMKGESLEITNGKIVNGRLTPGVTVYE
ncbi:MAG TPA: hypothetical protein VGQ09_01930 [Chitinophagaceae bacterium]|nr:hypothetical protein [Chitinophagaceae bacterium]